MKAIDTGGSIDLILVNVYSPGVAGTVRGASAELTTLEAGTGHNGTWAGSAIIPRYTNNGTWRIAAVILGDSGGGRTTYEPSGSEWERAWPSTFRVLAAPDTRRPVLRSLTLSATSVSTVHHVRRITVTARVIDSLSGVPRFGAVVRAAGSTALLGKKSGTVRNGIYQGTMTVPRWVGAGWHTWPLSVVIRDNLGNQVDYTPAELRTKHVTSSLKVLSTTDNSRPRLAGFMISPVTVDARTASQQVKVTVRASDTISVR